MAVHLVVLEVALVLLVLEEELVHAFAVEATLDEVTFVDAAVRFEDALTRLFATDVVALVEDLAFLPLFAALAVLLVIDPSALVQRVLEAAVERAATLRLAVLPVAPEDGAIGLRELTSTIELVIVELTTILAAVGELHNAEARGSLLFRVPLAAILATLADVLEVLVPRQVGHLDALSLVELAELGWREQGILAAILFDQLTFNRGPGGLRRVSDLLKVLQLHLERVVPRGGTLLVAVNSVGLALGHELLLAIIVVFDCLRRAAASFSHFLLFD